MRSDRAPQELGAYAAAVALQDVLRPPADSLYARLAARAPDHFDAADVDDTSASGSDDEPLCSSGLAGWCVTLACAMTMLLPIVMLRGPRACTA